MRTFGADAAQSDKLQAKSRRARLQEVMANGFKDEDNRLVKLGYGRDEASMTTRRYLFSLWAPRCRARARFHNDSPRDPYA